MRTVVTCPLCKWHYEVPPISPQAADQMALAGVFGPGVIAQHALNTQARDTEEALERHFAGHTTVEWVRKVSGLQREIDTLRSSLVSSDNP